MSADAASFLEEEQDFEYEEEILRNPYNLRLWLRYLASKKNASTEARHVLYERAVKLLPRSYKLWHAYLTERRIEVQDLCIVDRAVEAVNNCYERALVHLHKMPRIWLDYLAFMMKQKKGTSLRRSFDRCLQVRISCAMGCFSLRSLIRSLPAAVTAYYTACPYLEVVSEVGAGFRCVGECSASLPPPLEV
jgi:hypothetical protein